MAGHEIGEGARVTDALQDLLDDFRGKSRLLPQLRGALADLAMQRYERCILLIERGQIRRFADGRFEIAVRLAVMHGRTAAIPMQDQLHAAEIALHLADAGDRAGGVEHAGGDLIDVLFLSDGKDLAVGLLQSGFYGAQCRGTARANRRRKDRKSTRLNSSHLVISYAVFCLKKKKPASAPELHIANAAPPRRIASPDRVL